MTAIDDEQRAWKLTGCPYGPNLFENREIAPKVQDSISF
jgi:hypothetical protein